MDIGQLKESGLLELYAIGACTPEQQKIVESHLELHPNLLEDFKGISEALEAFAYAKRVNPSLELKERITSQIQRNSSTISPATNPSHMFKWISGLLGILSIIFGGLLFMKNQEVKNLKEQSIIDAVLCDSLLQEGDMQFAQLQDLQDTSNELLNFQATDNFSDVRLTLVHNRQNAKNYIQIVNLPSIPETQSYQLWSLKANQAPIPLTVFQGDEGIFIPVDFEANTGTYAITVESFGGQQSPTLENLVATVGV